MDEITLAASGGRSSFICRVPDERSGEWISEIKKYLKYQKFHVRVFSQDVGDGISSPGGQGIRYVKFLYIDWSLADLPDMNHFGLLYTIWYIIFGDGY